MATAPSTDGGATARGALRVKAPECRGHRRGCCPAAPWRSPHPKTAARRRQHVGSHGAAAAAAAAVARANAAAAAADLVAAAAAPSAAAGRGNGTG